MRYFRVGEPESELLGKFYLTEILIFSINRQSVQFNAKFIDY